MAKNEKDKGEAELSPAAFDLVFSIASASVENYFYNPEQIASLADEWGVEDELPLILDKLKKEGIEPEDIEPQDKSQKKDNG